jgi:hypothetical protein
MSTTHFPWTPRRAVVLFPPPDRGVSARNLPDAVPWRNAMRRGVSFGGILWLIIGLVVALSNGYGITNISSLVSFLLALFLWPLVLLGVSLHLQF